MGKVYETIEPRVAEFIEAQKMFFVATAPAGSDGLVNLSPKGLDTFRILDDRTIAYIDFVGSGVETIAHLRENGRIVICFFAFEGPPYIVRLHGRGEAIEVGDPGYAELRARLPEVAQETGVRSILRISVERISDSCGYGIPLYEYQGERSQIPEWAERKGEAGVADYRRENNAKSLDGLPGLRGT